MLLLTNAVIIFTVIFLTTTTLDGSILNFNCEYFNIIMLLSKHFKLSFSLLFVVIMCGTEMHKTLFSTVKTVRKVTELKHVVLSTQDKFGISN